MTALPDIAQPAGFDNMIAELDWVITDAITNDPRSLQKRIGPSEIGIPCARRIAYKLAGVQPVNDRGLPWKPAIGTAFHDWLRRTFAAANARFGNADGLGPRWLLEHRVTVGQAGGEDIDGSCDLYDRVSRTVLDWKLVGADAMRKYKANGPGDQYRAQAHAYGRGWVARGYPVDRVAVYFLPREREWRERYAWHEPYDEQTAVDALAKVDGIAKLVTALGPAAAGVLPTADAWCSFCPHYLPAATEPAEACPGHPGSAARIT